MRLVRAYLNPLGCQRFDFFFFAFFVFFGIIFFAAFLAFLSHRLRSADDALGDGLLLRFLSHANSLALGFLLGGFFGRFLRGLFTGAFVAGFL